jgi:hypothetical protein
MELEPKEHILSKALFRGIVGHRIWEAYYQALKDGFSVDEAKQIGLKAQEAEIEKVVRENPEHYDMIQIAMELRTLFDTYTEVYRVDDFKPLEVESVFKTTMRLGLEYGLRLDVLAEMTKGEFRGDIVVLDHKFLYNFKTPDEIDMDGQLPKYISTVKDNGIVVTKGRFNMIRYRSLKNNRPEDLFHREWIKPKKAEIEQIWKDQTIVSNEIEYMKQLPPAAASEAAVRNMSPYICRSCYFKKLCKLELNGQDITNAVVMDYQPNTYGYQSYVED